MRKEGILKNAVRTALSVDADQIVEEISSADIDFVDMENANRGLTHEYAEAAFLRGDSSTWKRTFVSSASDNLNRIPTLRSFFQTVPSDFGRMILARLDRESVIKAHRDTHPYFSTTLRFHIPLITNEHVWFFNSGKVYQMKKGEVWCIDNAGIHGVVNGGTEKRLHVIFDVFIDHPIVELVRSGEHGLGIDAHEKPEIMAKVRMSHQDRLERRRKRLALIKKRGESRIGVK